MSRNKCDPDSNSVVVSGQTSKPISQTTSIEQVSSQKIPCRTVPSQDSNFIISSCCVTQRPITGIVEIPAIPGSGNEITGCTQLTSCADENRCITLAGTVNQGTPGSLPWLVDVVNPITAVVSGPLAVTQSGTWNINSILNPVPITGTVVATVPNPLPVSQSGTWNIETLTSITDPVTVTGTVTATIPNPLPVSQSGIWDINNISGVISLPTGAATEATLSTLLTTSAFQARINTLGQKTMANSTPVVIASDQSAIPISGSLTPSGTQDVNLKQVGGNTVLTGNGVTGTGSQRVTIASDNTAFSVNAIQSGTWTVNQGGSPWQVQSNSANIATESTLAKLTLAQGSTTSGQSGPLIQGAVSNSDPGYFDGQTSPISLTSAGHLRVDLTGTTVNATVTSAEVTGTSEHTTVISASGQSASIGGTAPGTYKAAAATSFAFSLSFASTHTVTFEASDDTVNWLTVSAFDITSDSNVGVTSLTGNSTHKIYVVPHYAPNYAVRARCTVFSGSSFSISVGTVSLAAANQYKALPSGSNVIGAVTQSGGWTVTANAGTNLNTSLLALESGGNLATLAGGVSSSVYQSNIKQINGVVPLMGNGVTGTGSQRVTIASDNTAFTVNAAQSGSWSTTQLNGKTLVSAGGSASSSGDNTIVAAGTNKLKVYAFTLSTVSTTQVTCIFKSGAGGTELWRVTLQAPSGANSGANLAVSPPAWLFNTASATLLNLNLSSAQTVHWSVSYFDEA